MPELHPYSNYVNQESRFIGGFVPHNATKVIIGTFPPEVEYLEKGDGFFFYSSERNHLWNRFDNILGTSLKKTANRNANESFTENRDRKMQFCRETGIGFIDIFEYVDRAFVGANADSDLIPVINIVENGTLENLVNKNQINRICCVYVLAYDTLMQELANANAQIVTHLDEMAANGIIHEVTIFDNTFEVVLLYPATRSKHTREAKDRQYQHFLL